MNLKHEFDKFVNSSQSQALDFYLIIQAHQGMPSWDWERAEPSSSKSSLDAGT